MPYLLAPYSLDESEALSATGYATYECDWIKRFSI